jgi:hypothetical protein
MSSGPPPNITRQSGGGLTLSVAARVTDVSSADGFLSWIEHVTNLARQTGGQREWTGSAVAWDVARRQRVEIPPPGGYGAASLTIAAGKAVVVFAQTAAPESCVDHASTCAVWKLQVVDLRTHRRRTLAKSDVPRDQSAIPVPEVADGLVAWEQVRSEGVGLELADINGSNAPRELLATRRVTTRLTIDGASLYMGDPDQQGVLIKVPLSGGSPTRIVLASAKTVAPTVHNGVVRWLATSGNSIYLNAVDQRSVAGGPTRTVLRLDPEIYDFRWDGALMIVAGPNGLVGYSAASGARPIDPRARPQFGYDVDGDSVVYAEQDPHASGRMVITIRRLL